MSTTDTPPRKHRSTIYRTAKRLTASLEGGSAGIYWPPEQLATWHRDDLGAVANLAERAGVQTMMLRGELCWHLEP